jgi:hypothetical protein
MYRSFWAAASVLAFVVCAPSAMAGEWNKQRGYIHGTADDPLPANSSCAFSGLDEPDDVDENNVDDNPLWASTPAGGIVQAYGQLVATGLKAFVPAPGSRCRGGGPSGD